MERLTKRNEKGLAILAFKCPEECEHSTCSIEEGYQCQHQCEGDIIEKLATYEEFEEIFREKMASVACELLSDKEEFGKWLDRNKWIIKKCDEYARAEEQGFLLRLPCKVGDKVYYISEGFIEPCTVEVIFLADYIDKDGNKSYMAEIHFDREDCPYVSTEIYFTDIGKTVFLTQAEAKQKLKELENRVTDIKSRKE